ncbi:MAG: AMP-binding protein [Bacteroidales bacterium]|nr:AMP-binding protein [Bacteroidales bacterium]
MVQPGGPLGPFPDNLNDDDLADPVMERDGSYIINDRNYTKAELLSMATEKISPGRAEKWEVDLYRFIIDFLDEEVPLIQKTSGTTGDPCVFPMSRQSMILSAKRTIEHFRLEPGNSALLCLPVEYIAGKMMVVRALTGKLNLVTMGPSGNPLRSLDRPIHFAAVVPLQLNEFVAYRDALEGIGILLVGGGEMNRTLREGLTRIARTRIFETFAMSETYSHFAFRQINGQDPGKFFRVMNGVRIKTDDRGCLLVDIPGITNGAVATNDLVTLHGNDAFEWMGRADNVIKSGGVKILPEILEKRIREILNTEIELLITGIPDPVLGSKLVLVLERGDDPAILPLEQWMNTLRSHLRKHELPKAIHVVPGFPRNEVMKVLRRRVIDFIDLKSPDWSQEHS